ncbi:MAG: hypothetical protein RL722_559 [Pseudomonadota bacterium]|jgi:cytochrome c oxidase cbb3-type subunit 4
MDLDINTLRSAVTVVSLLLFVGIMVWTFQRKRQSAWDEAAALPFAADDIAQQPASQASLGGQHE